MSARAILESKATADDRPLMIGACCVAVSALVPVAMYQLGITAELPDPPLSVFDSERITMSKTAHPLGIPDAVLGIASFSTTLTLAILAKRNRTAARLLGIKLGLDASAATFNAVRQVVEFRKLCSWCTATALSAGMMTYGGRDSLRRVLMEGADIARKVVAKKIRA